MRLLLGISTCTLLVATWKLWVPGTFFPHIPLVSFLRGFPVGVAWGILAGIAVGGLLLLFPREKFFRTGGVLLTVSFWCSFLWNQHTLQPWAWQFSILGFVIAMSSHWRTLELSRLLVISIYVHSGFSKLDITFLESHGQHLLNGLLQVFGGSLETFPVGLRPWLTAMLPVSELLLALLLLLPRTRLIGMWAGMFLHFLLIITLSPLGLNHHAGVLLWNLFFLGLLRVLFRNTNSVPVSVRSEKVIEPNRVKTWLTNGLITLVILLPLLEPWGWFDRWPSWAVYASRPAQMDVYLSRDAARELPENLQLYLSPVMQEVNGTFWQEFHLDRWSLGILDVPILPEVRFQLGAVEWLWKQQSLEDAVSVRVSSAADRFTGQRKIRWLDGRADIQAALKTYLVNGFP